MKCFLCLEEGSSRCAFCEDVWSCSEEHIKLHRFDDKCLPFRIERNDRVGKYMVANRDLDPLELVLVDHPATIGPSQGEERKLCVSCMKLHDPSFGQCGFCLLPVCDNEECRNSERHKLECDFFQERNLTFTEDHLIVGLIRSLSILRLLLLRDKNPALWNQLKMLMDHLDDRKQDKITWEYCQEKIVNFLLLDLNLKDLFSEDEVQRCLGIIRVNGIQMPEKSDAFAQPRCIFPRMAMMSNSCICNCRCIYMSGERLAIRVQVPVKKNQELTIGYTSLLSGSLKRRQNFRDVWFFDCKCERCSDPTENGSLINAFKCTECKGDGILLAENPLLYESSWKCDKCPHTVTGDHLKLLEDELEAEIRSVPPGSWSSYEALLAEWSGRMHSNHYLLMRIKSNLISLYGNIPQMKLETMPQDKITRKLQLCEEFLRVFDHIDPGCTDWRAMTMYETVKTKLFVAQRDFQEQRLPLTEFKEELKGLVEDLKDVRKSLEVEEKGTYKYNTMLSATACQKNIEELLMFADFL